MVCMPCNARAGEPGVYLPLLRCLHPLHPRLQSTLLDTTYFVLSMANFKYSKFLKNKTLVQCIWKQPVGHLALGRQRFTWPWGGSASCCPGPSSGRGSSCPSPPASPPPPGSSPPPPLGSFSPPPLPPPRSFPPPGGAPRERWPGVPSLGWLASPARPRWRRPS